MKIFKAFGATSAGLFAATALTTAAPTIAHAQQQYSPNEVINAFEASNGKRPGFRRSGAKGICATGEFIGNAEGRALSSASAFNGRPHPVIIRFSNGGASPTAPDKAKAQRNLALQIKLPNDELWQMGNISTPVFGVSTPEKLVALLQSRIPDPATGKPDPDKVKAFNDANPEIQNQAKALAAQPIFASYGSINYYGVNTFAFVNAKGQQQWVKWTFEPVKGTRGLTEEELKALPDAYLFDDLRKTVAAGPLEFNYRVQLPEAGDVLDNPTIALPEDRKKITVGKLIVKQVEPGDGGACDKMSFAPTILPKGVEPSADPTLTGRAGPYAASLRRRVTEAAAAATGATPAK